MRSLPKSFAAKLENIVGATYIETDRNKLENYARDETPNLKALYPDVLVKPKNKEEITRIMQLCAAEKVYLTPRGAGTGKAGGSVALYGGVLLDYSRLNNIINIDTHNLTATVQPGVILSDFQAAVEATELFYPPDPASLAMCSIGGNVATNAGGPRALKYGVTKNYVLGLDVVLPSGKAMFCGKRTVKGVAGYDITSLLCGSEGTLALINEITLKLIPKPAFVQTALILFASAQNAGAAISAVFKGGIIPRTLEFMDKKSISALRKYGSEYQFKENTGAALILETDGISESSSFEQLEQALIIIQNFNTTDILLAQNAQQKRQIWNSRRSLSAATKALRGKKLSEDIVVPRSKIPEMVDFLNTKGQEYDLETCSFGHAGDGNLHVQVLYQKDTELAKVELLIEDVFRKTIALQGTISGEHGIGLAKKAYLPWEQSSALIALQKKLKKSFDPEGLLNPGKIF